ncbi:hypothetical protein GCM10010121_007650 [Streptomyces brasiliensis]|uniref:SCO1431 family membrane protein n=1 Tax=Streptomyces brasiliensis TaxID=1954 RepID=A0A917K3Q5_9ACTN|nr:hypothetical protein GCM10010121_007650 [Streptomyces brasiliensis]
MPVTNVSAASAADGGKVDETVGGVHPYSRPQRDAMTAHSATAARTRTGGPKDDGPKILEHVMGWTLVMVVAMLVTQLGLM